MHLQGHTDRCVHTHTRTTPLNNVLLYLCLKYSLSSVSFYSATSHTLSSFLLHFVLNSSFLLSSLPSSFSNPSGLPVMWLLCFCWIKHRPGERERRREMKRNVDSEETERLRKKERSREWKKQTRQIKSRLPQSLVFMWKNLFLPFLCHPAILLQRKNYARRGHVISSKLQ